MDGRYQRRHFQGLEDVRSLASVELQQLLERELCAHVPVEAYHETIVILRELYHTISKVCAMAELTYERTKHGEIKLG
jgi:hypothetical protein